VIADENEKKHLPLVPDWVFPSRPTSSGNDMVKLYLDRNPYYDAGGAVHVGCSLSTLEFCARSLLPDRYQSTTTRP
jgi:hypothetical protein